MKAGDLKYRVTFLVPPAPSDDPMDNGEGGWTDGSTVLAKVLDQLPPRADQMVDSVLRGRRPTAITIRYREGITPDMRIRFRGRVLEIVSGPAEIGFREGLQILAVDYSARPGAA